ncbi:hypothetical protein NC652_034506 [Populus alba x Populus x berolinensis]|nr:hypothetical protein NC652_034506 [Populus alba x Populus x berolinensis]
MVSWPFSVCPLFLVFVLPGFYVLFVLSVRCFVFCSSRSSLFFLFSQFIIRFSSLDLPLGSFSLPCLRPLISLCHSLSLSTGFFLPPCFSGFFSPIRPRFFMGSPPLSAVFSCFRPPSFRMSVFFLFRLFFLFCSLCGSLLLRLPPLSSSSLLCLCPFFSGFFSSGYIFL